MRFSSVVRKTLDWLDGYPYRISEVFLILQALSFVPLCLRVGNFFQSRWNPFPKFSDSQVLLLGSIDNVLLLIAMLAGIVMCVVPLLPLVCGRFRTAAKTFVGMMLALFLTAVVWICMGPLVFCFAGELTELEAAERRCGAERSANVPAKGKCTF